MKKRFLNLALLSLLTVSMPIGFTSCSDNDDDIDRLDQTTNDLTSQIAKLSEAIDANKTAAANAAANADAAIKAAAEAAQKGDKALAEAQAAAAQAELAKHAAAQAKADALAEIKAQAEALQKLISANSSAIETNAKDIAALLGRIEGVEAQLKALDVEKIISEVATLQKDLADQIAASNKALEAVNVQLAALESFKTLIEGKMSTLEGTVAGLSTELSTVKGNIETLTSDLKELQGSVSTLTASVATNTSAIASINTELASVNTKLTDLSAKITTEVANAINTIAGVISSRLTSVTLMPDLYIDGIPTIEFVSAQYVPAMKKGGDWVPSTKPAVIVSNNETEVQYRLNPATIGEGDINKGGLAFVSRVATARAAEVENDLINVSSASINGGVLTVKAGKSNTKTLNLAGNKINIVSLKVPIAEKHLFTEQGEKEANVYSEYTRLNEVYFRPELDKSSKIASDIPVNFNDSTAIYATAMNNHIAYELQYNETINLEELVQPCAFSNNSHSNLSYEQLRKYGFDVYFHVANAAYTAGNHDMTDQQKYAKIVDGNILTPVLPTGETGNMAIIDKQPIIAATLVDVTNKNIVQQVYFKVLFKEKTVEPIVVDVPEFEADLDCDGFSWDMTWTQMVDLVMKNLNNGAGMSQKDFMEIYKKENVQIVNCDYNSGENVNVYILNDGGVAANTVINWTGTNEHIGHIDLGKSKTFTVTVKFVDETGINPTIIINLKGVVTAPESLKPVLGSTDPIKWQNEVMLVYPTPFEDIAGATAEYSTNILQGRIKPYAKNLLSCATYDVDYRNKSSYQGEALAFQAGYGHHTITSANQANLNDITYNIANNASGKALVAAGAKVEGGKVVAGKDVVLDWSAYINGLAVNNVVFGTSYLRVVYPLYLNTTLAKGITDDSTPQTINLSDNLTLTDAYGHEVAHTNDGKLTQKLWDYYVVEDPEFGSNVMLATDANGSNAVSLESLNMSANVDTTTGDLTFVNRGAALQDNRFLMVPVTIEHKWGTITGKVAVPLNKKF